MPIVDIEFVTSDTEEGRAALPTASALAAAIGGALHTAAGRTWVRVRTLAAGRYAENDVPALSPAEWPVFVTVLHAHPPAGALLAAEVQVLTQTIASCCACSTDRVHVQYAPAAAGRQAFGGSLVE